MGRITGSTGSPPVTPTSSSEKRIVAQDTVQPQANPHADDAFEAATINPADRGSRFKTSATQHFVVGDWAYPSDPLKIVSESNTPPEGFDPTTIPGTGEVKYYVTEINYQAEVGDFKRLTQSYWIQRNAGKITGTGWIPNKEDSHPDFLWRRSEKDS